MSEWETEAEKGERGEKRWNGLPKQPPMLHCNVLQIRATVAVLIANKKTTKPGVGNPSNKRPPANPPPPPRWRSNNKQTPGMFRSFATHMPTRKPGDLNSPKYVLFIEFRAQRIFREPPTLTLQVLQLHYREPFRNDSLYMPNHKETTRRSAVLVFSRE